MAFESKTQQPSDLGHKYVTEKFEIRPAVRHAVPQIMAISGVTFSGKTYGALMLAAGLVEPGQKIGFVDTENGRGEAYADDPDVRAAIPKESWVDGAPYAYLALHPPFHPARYIAAYRALEGYGCGLIITDSGSHAWDGEGGAQDMKERDKGWTKAKLWTKRFSMAIRYSPVHHIVCLRAQEKTKIVEINGKQNYIPLGVLPICEKGFPFDLGLFFSVEGEKDGKPATHLATPLKWPKAMNPLFSAWKPQLLTPEIGRKVREWNNSVPKEDPAVRLRNQSRAAAEDGMEAYKTFFASLTAAQKKVIEPIHEENKGIAADVDKTGTQPGLLNQEPAA